MGTRESPVDDQGTLSVAQRGGRPAGREGGFRYPHGSKGGRCPAMIRVGRQVRMRSHDASSSAADGPDGSMASNSSRPGPMVSPHSTTGPVAVVTLRLM